MLCAPRSMIIRTSFSFSPRFSMWRRQTRTTKDRSGSAARDLGLTLLRVRVAAVFDIGVETDLATTLARFARAAIDGALLAVKVDGASLSAMLAPLPTALVAIHGASCEAGTDAD